VIKSEAGFHRSPNAGWPEAAMAHTLNIALSGPRMYDGAATDDPYVNVQGNHDLGPADIDRAVQVLWKTWGLALLAAMLAGLVRL
jgi:adenosylcobinamide-phosphate synthase